MFTHLIWKNACMYNVDDDDNEKSEILLGN